MMARKPSALAVAMACILLAPSSTADAASDAMTPGASLLRPGSLRRRAFVAPASAVSKRRRYRSTQRLSRITLAGANKYGGKDKLSQEELLRDLERRVDDYEGRIPSKMTGPPLTSSETDGSDADATISPATTSTPPSTTLPHRCALVTILGLPNMGKSTLLNALLSDDLAIATSRPQTTRHAILGVMTADWCQLCLTDTPGIINSPAYQLQEGMMDAVKGAVRDADVFLVVMDVCSVISDKEGNDEEMTEVEDLGIGEEMLTKLRTSQRPVIVCVNKVDLVADGEGGGANTPARAVHAVRRLRSVLPDAFAILPTCAADGPDDPGVVALRSILLANDPGADVGGAVRGLGRPVAGMFAGGALTISEKEARGILPVGPPLYHSDFFTDRTDRFCASELIRETLFENLGKELPYCCEVRVEAFDESERYGKKAIVRIGATVIVERDSQKGIVVGKGGRKIKDVGTDARRKLHEFFGVRVFLDLRVKVDKDWRNNKDKLKKYGYM